MRKIIISIVFITIIFLANLSFARIEDYLQTNNLDDYNPANTNISTSESNYDDVAYKTGKVLGYVKIIGTVISVGVLMVLGIKYMIGSVEERASYKKTFIPYLIGAAILFTGTLLPDIIYNWTRTNLT